MRQRRVGIDLTPLVDVVFLLLIFFMVSTTFRDEEGMELRLPEARSSAPAQTEDVLRVTVARDGSIRFRGQTLDPQALEHAVGAAMVDSEQRQVIVEADSRVAHGVVVGVMDSLRRAGARGLTVGTKPPSE